MSETCGAPPEWWVETLRELLLPGPRSAPVNRELANAIVTFVTSRGPMPDLSRVGYGMRPTIVGPEATALAQRLYSDPQAVCAHVWARWAHVVGALSFGLNWLEALVVHLHTTLGTETTTPYETTTLAAIAAGNGVDFDGFVQQLWHTVPTYPYGGHGQRSLPTFAGYDDLVRRLHDRLAPSLSADDLNVRIQAATLLIPVQDVTLESYAPELVKAAVSGSAKVRRAVEPLVVRAGERALEQLWDRATTAPADACRHALDLLWNLAEGETEWDRVRKTAEADRSSKVRELVSSFDLRASTDRTWQDLPIPLEPQWQVPASDALRTVLLTFLPGSSHLSGESDVPRNTRWPTLEELVAELMAALASSSPSTDVIHGRVYGWSRSEAVRGALVDGTLTPEAALQLLVATDLLESASYHGYPELTWTARLLHRHQGLTLLDLAVLIDGLGLDGTQLVCEAWFHPSDSALGRNWDPADLWTFFATRLDAVLELWQGKRSGSTYGFDTEALFLALGTLPSLPTDVARICFDIALGAAKSDRRAAQDLLGTHEETAARTVAALKDGSAVVRAVAAEWLGRLGDRSAVAALAAAQQREKNETTQGVMLEALVALGERVADHLDLASLDATAARAMAQGTPDVVSGLGLGMLPAVHRAGDGRTVPSTTMQWLVVRAVGTKSPVPTAVVSACLEQVAEPDRQRFGDALLGRWVAGDEATLGQSAAIERSRWFGDRVVAKPTGATTRGSLALVAACGGPESVTAAARYIRTWHGQRATQSKALISMLAHHSDPSAAEVLVGIAYRFKAPSIERLAREEVAALAERRGWSLDELADRTVATAGFGDDGQLVLSYGEREFTARLTPELEVELRDHAGKVVKALPAARAGEDADTVKRAKSALSAARKQLKETVAQQTVRLHDAMCTQRGWDASAWRRDLADHPVLARLAGRLVWVAEGERRTTFRMLDDGSLTDATDEPVTLHDADVLRIAHDVTLTDEEITTWRQHLTDFEVRALFAQLGHGRAVLSEEEMVASVVPGPVEPLPIGALDRASQKQGYRRGAVGDGAVYGWLEKTYDTVGIQVRIGLEDGADISDHQAQVRVEGLSFVDPATEQPRLLGEVPPVLLVEARHDLALLTGSSL